MAEVQGIRAAAPTTRRRSRKRVRENIAGWLWTSPWILGFLLWTLGPMVYSAYLAFTKYSIAKPPVWIGLENFQRALSGADSLFWPSLFRTFVWAGVMAPLTLVGSLFAAILLNQKLKGTPIFRTLFFLPSLTPAVAAALLWQWLFQPDFGPINYLLGMIGVSNPPLWFSDSAWAMPSLMIMTI